MRDFDRFPRPPGQSTLRLLPGEGGAEVVLTNQPDRQLLVEDLQMKGPLGRAMARTLRGPFGLGEATGLSCFASAAMAVGYLFLLFGVVFFAGMLISLWVFDVPVQVNGRPAGKLAATASIALFGTVWIGFVCLWIYLARWAGLGGAAGFFTLTLGEDEWVARSSPGRVLGRCRPGAIERIAADSRGRVVADVPEGRVILAGPLPGHDAQWLQQALARKLGLRSEPDEAAVAYPCVPALAIQPGEHLTHRLRHERAWAAALGCLAFTLIWNGFISVFIWHVLEDHRRGRPYWFATIFLIPFVAIGLLLIVGIVVGALSWLYEALVHGRRGRTVLELSSHPLVLGESCRAFLRQDGSYFGYALTVSLVCEEHATYRQGTSSRTDSKRVQEIELLRTEEIDLHPGQPFERTFPFEVPAAAMHSFEASHNRIDWKLVVAGGRHSGGGKSGWWTRSRTFACVVQPPPPRATIGGDRDSAVGAD